jgi:predicted ABC-type transport system involved in lysophospholipase L1 biosynthesis ATPase subunit
VTAALEISGVVKDYNGLRPLRIEQLTAQPGEQIALVGLDAPSAEVLVNLITGTTLPDRGEIRVFGERTADIQNGDAWMTFVDHLGIVSERAVLLDGLSVVQNLAIPFSLDVEPLSPDLRARALALAQEVGLEPSMFEAPVGGLEQASRVRVRLGRALALDPALVLIEHPSLNLGRDQVAPLGRDIRATIAKRGASGLTLTADGDLAKTIADRALKLDPATGRLTALGASWLDRFRNM